MNNKFGHFCQFFVLLILREAEVRRAACRGMALLVLYLAEEEEEDEAKFDQVWQISTSLMKVITSDK